MELDWTHQEDYFDFIHARNVSQSISNWPKLMDEIYACTTPGGYVELAETGGSSPLPPPLRLSPTEKRRLCIDGGRRNRLLG